MLAMMGVCSQLPLSSKDLKVFCDSLPVNALDFFTKHLEARFVALYEECATTSDQYLEVSAKMASSLQLLSC